MAHRLPPFSSLRAFEAAARHLNFHRAAEELHVTPSAVSHQIKALETYLGVPLFTRSDRRLRMTEAGMAYFPTVRDALDRLEAATTRLCIGRDRQILTISLLPTFATRWLIPRLPDFQEKHPAIEVRLTTSVELVDFSRTDVDIALRYGRGGWPGLRCDRLMAEDVFPVCSPALRRAARLKAPVDLRGQTLLHNQSQPGEWRIWLAAAGVDGIEADRGPRFASSDLALRAAAEGMGVALGRRPLVDEDMTKRRLVALFDFRLTSGVHYYLVCPETTATRPKIEAFRHWLLQQVSP